MFQTLLPSHDPHILPTVQMLMRALEEQGVRCIESPLRFKHWRAIAKAAAFFHIRRNPFYRSKEPFFAQLNHTWPNAFYPFFLSHPLVTYSFDLWPCTWDEWVKVFRFAAPKISFISAKVPLDEMRRRLPEIDFRWLPEAVDPCAFDSTLPLANRPIDVLEVGRQFYDFHKIISAPLAKADKIHLYPIPGHNAPISYGETVAKYGKSKICLVFPRSVTHPAQAQGVETTTFRYFECMASKTLMYGHCPQELLEILGYNPVISADMINPSEQLLSEILPNIAKYQNFVEKNYQSLCSKWTTNHQASVIKSALSELA